MQEGVAERWCNPKQASDLLSIDERGRLISTGFSTLVADWRILMPLSAAAAASGGWGRRRSAGGLGGFIGGKKCGVVSNRVALANLHQVSVQLFHAER